MSKFIPLSEPFIFGNEKKYAMEAIESSWISNSGKYLDDFEDKILEFTKSKYVSLCINGTSALHLALKALDIKKDDEIIIPNLSFISTVNSVLYCGANPIFLGSDEYFNLCEEDFLNFLEECTEFKNNITYNKLTKKRIKALIVVHVWGNACKLDKILEKCRARNIKIVEDAAESLGTFYEQGFLKGKHTGTIGDVGCISFNGNKIITTGGGGAVLSQSEKVARKIKYLSTQAKDDSFHYIHNEIGYNYRLSNVNAAIGLAQIENIDKILTKKKEINSWYKDIFQRNNFLQIYDPPTYSKNNHWLNILKIDKEERLKKLKKLNDNNINARPVWKLFSEQEYLKNYECHGLMKSKKLVEESICLPSSYSLEVEDVRKIFEILKD